MHWTSKSCHRSPAVSLYKFIYREAKYKRPSWNCKRSDSVPPIFCHEIALSHTEYPSASIEPQKAVAAVSFSLWFLQSAEMHVFQNGCDQNGAGA